MVGFFGDVGDGVVGLIVVPVVVAVLVVFLAVGLGAVSNTMSRRRSSTNPATIAGSVQGPMIERSALKTRMSRRRVTGIGRSSSSRSNGKWRRRTVPDAGRGENGVVARA